MKIRKMGLALILMAVITITACAQKYDNENNFVVKPIDDGKGVEITDYAGNKFEVNIPPQIKNLPVTSIGKQAFANEKNIISITMPNSVTNIGLMAFASCTSLNSITIPANVTNIDNAAFTGCTRLTAINIAGGNKTYASQDGVLYDKSKTTLIKYPQGKIASTFTIPNSVTSIEKFAFENCTNLTSVTFQGTIAPDKFGSKYINLNDVLYSPFDGDLCEKYLAGGPGTYIVVEQAYGVAKTWTKQ